MPVKESRGLHGVFWVGEETFCPKTGSGILKKGIKKCSREQAYHSRSRLRFFTVSMIESKSFCFWDVGQFRALRRCMTDTA